MDMDTTVELFATDLVIVDDEYQDAPDGYCDDCGERLDQDGACDCGDQCGDCGEEYDAEGLCGCDDWTGDDDDVNTL